MPDFRALLDGCRLFRPGPCRERRLRQNRLSQGPTAKIMVIACSDRGAIPPASSTPGADVRPVQHRSDGPVAATGAWVRLTAALFDSADGELKILDRTSGRFQRLPIDLSKEGTKG